MDNHPFEMELIEMADKDLINREKLLSTGKLSGGYHPEMESIHRSNAKRLREIIADIGYPTISKVGEKASNAAWLIIQHAISEPEFIKACYVMMKENKDDINPLHIAYLHDRILVFQSKPQKYGTQLTSGGAIYPVRNKANLNIERKKVNLPALSNAEIDKILKPEDITEIDDKVSGYTHWRKKVGWI
ncbi:DUF6624 domain-containing protein [Sphingobacterium deserti]|uniref:Uncharacterized protein n=1 Tax=Sphingobacterium deserti TaxID=1229276 RepID=A0A0B8SYK6_9SPHI|nr:DUF6624 domain-containing protein [Sphingobacterium deserti]KGE12282.1 hypothetical protein DI53_3932 [Sphingobacterium deserti]